MQELILIVHVLAAVAIIALVLMQHGKGADIGATFGSGSAHTVFGSQGSLSFLMKLTGLLALIFFATSLGLSYLASHREKQPNVFDRGLQQQQRQTIPKTPMQPQNF